MKVQGGEFHSCFVAELGLGPLLSLGGLFHNLICQASDKWGLFGLNEILHGKALPIRPGPEAGPVNAGPLCPYYSLPPTDTDLREFI